MMSLLYTIVAFIIALGLLVVIHELGHYWIARLCNVKVLRFSIGLEEPEDLIQLRDALASAYAFDDVRGVISDVASELSGIVRDRAGAAVPDAPVLIVPWSDVFWTRTSRRTPGGVSGSRSIPCSAPCRASVLPQLSSRHRWTTARVKSSSRRGLRPGRRGSARRWST